MKKAFIEYDFPVKEVSEHSAREKNIRHGHISTLHIWWARRPLAASRATIYASLVPEPKDKQEWEERSKFIAELSKWENSNNKELIEKARQDILDTNDGVAPKVLDPFAGGGAIPLEALRLGCETYASDLNPVAVLIEKATLEYPQKYGQPILRKQYFDERPWMKDDKKQGTIGDDTVNPLLEDVKYWGNYVLEEAKKELAKFYPPDPDGNIPVGYLWVKLINCVNPGCKVDIPLVKQTWLAKKKNKKVAYKLDNQDGKIVIKIVEDNNIDFNPSEGTLSRGKVICPVCNTGISPNEYRRLLKKNIFNEKMIVVVLKHPKKQGKKYRAANESDINTFSESHSYLNKQIDIFSKSSALTAIPDELIPSKDSHRAVGSQLPLYGHKSWGDLFNPRQLSSLLFFTNMIKRVICKMDELTISRDYMKAIALYQALGLDRLVDYGSRLCLLNPTGGRGVVHTFGRSALQMVTDYMESNPLNPYAAGWVTACDKNIKWIGNATFNTLSIPITQQSSSININYPDEYFDAIFTDPPYYDSVPYSDLSDFFYVWLKRSIGNLFKQFFNTPLTPKSEEIIEISKDHDKKSKIFFEEMLAKSFREICRVLNKKGICHIVYAHKSYDAWETVINAILNAELYLSSSWPLHTEMKGRLQAQGTASLASSIYMVCRKRNTNETAFYNEVKPAIEKRIHKKLDQFWAEGIGGSDFFISAIGPAVEVFGKYASVEKLSGEKVTVKELLEYVRQVVSEHALNRILKNTQLGGIDNTTRFYLIWRFTYGNAKVMFDDASKLSRAIGFDLEANWDSAGIVKKDKQFITIKSPVDRRNDERFKHRIAKHFPDIVQETLFDDEIITTEAPSMIDVLHQCLIFWNRNDRLTIVKLLEGSGYRNNNHFWQVAQSISDVLKDGDKEKQLLQGFLYGKEGYQSGKVLVDDKPDAQEKIFGGDK